jgi:hypothetical protein
MSPKITKLLDGETMNQRRAIEQLDQDCAKIARAVDRNPGLYSKAEIGNVAGLTAERVAVCLRQINHNDTPFHRIDYGVRTAKDGPFAGQTRRGWWPMKRASYQPVLDQADEHTSRVEHGLRHSRLTRLACAYGLGTQAAAAAIASIEARLEVDVGSMTEVDLEAFEELLAEELDV